MSSWLFLFTTNLTLSPALSFSLSSHEITGQDIIAASKKFSKILDIRLCHLLTNVWCPILSAVVSSHPHPPYFRTFWFNWGLFLPKKNRIQKCLRNGLQFLHSWPQTHPLFELDLAIAIHLRLAASCIYFFSWKMVPVFSQCCFLCWNSQPPLHGHLYNGATLFFSWRQPHGNVY